MEVAVRRNAYGRQLESFETDLYIIPLGKKLFKGVFIRAPKIESVGMGTEVLCQLNGNVVAIKQGKMIACTFHPELTEDDRFHRYFLELI